MKYIFTALTIMLAQAALGIPGRVLIEIEESVYNASVYSIEGVRTGSFEDFADQLKELALLGKESSSEELHFHIHLKGNVNLYEILRIKEVLTPFGFNYYTIQSMPNYGAVITVTIGQPEDFQLVHAKKKGAIVPYR
jgi:hypothetical protein